MASSIQDTLLDVTVGAFVGVPALRLHVLRVAVLDQRRALCSFFLQSSELAAYKSKGIKSCNYSTIFSSMQSQEISI